MARKMVHTIGTQWANLCGPVARQAHTDWLGSVAGSSTGRANR